MNQVKPSMNMCCLLLGHSFEPRPKSHALGKGFLGHPKICGSLDFILSIEPYFHSLEFVVLIEKKKGLYESSETFDEHELLVAGIRYSFEPRPIIEPRAWYSGFNYEHRFIDKRMLALEKPV